MKSPTLRIGAGLVILVAAVWLLSGLRSRPKAPETPETLAESATIVTKEAIPPEVRSLIPRPHRQSSPTNTARQELLAYSPPFRPKSMIPKALRGNLHAQQVLIVLEEAQVNPAIIQLEFKNIYNHLGSIKDLQMRNAADMVRRYESIAEILNRTQRNPDALEEEMGWRDDAVYSGSLVYERFIDQHRQAILTALSGTKIASDPELQQRLFNIHVQLDLSTEAIEFMKSYSPAPATLAP